MLHLQIPSIADNWEYLVTGHEYNIQATYQQVRHTGYLTQQCIARVLALTVEGMSSACQEGLTMPPMGSLHKVLVLLRWTPVA